MLDPLTGQALLANLARSGAAAHPRPRPTRARLVPASPWRRRMARGQSAIAVSTPRNRFQVDLVAACGDLDAMGEPRASRRRLKTQSALPTGDSALILLFGLVATGQMILRKLDGYAQLAAVIRERMRSAA